MSYKGTDKCISKAFDDEMLFVLMARDETAPATVLEWIKLNIGKQPEEKLREAFECAMEMVRTNAEMQYRKGLTAPAANRILFNPIPKATFSDQAKIEGLYTVYHSTTKKIGVLRTWDLVVPDRAQLYRFRNGDWELEYDKAIHTHKYIRFDFYDEQPSEELRMRIPCDGEAYIEYSYIEYAFRILYDGTIELVKAHG